MLVWIWDVAAIVLIAYSAFDAYRCGFFRSLVNFVGTMASFLVGWFYAGPIARWCYGSFLAERIAEGVQEGLVAYGAESFETALSRLDEVLRHLPSLVTEAVRSQIEADSFEVWYQNMIRANSGDIAAALTDGVVAPIVTTVLQILVFCLLFMICSAVVQFAAGLIGGVRKVPLLGQADGLVGAVFGALRGILYVFVLAAVLWLIIRLTGDALPFLKQKELEQTVLFGRFFRAVSRFGIST